MSIELIAQITPKNGGEFALVDDQDLRGSFRVVPDIPTMNAIPSDNRKVGMHVYITNENATFILSSDMSTWVEEPSGDKSFIFQQPSGSKTWTINHGLNKYPAVSIVDFSGNNVSGVVDYSQGLDTIVIEFNSIVSGLAYLN